MLEEISQQPEANANDDVVEMQPAPLLDHEEENNVEDEGFSEAMNESEDESNDDNDDNNNNNNNNNFELPLNEPNEEDINAWMTPKRAREKELLLLAQYRRCQKLARQRTYALEAQKQQKKKMTILSTKLKRQTLRVKGLEKIIRDILNVQWLFTFKSSYGSYGSNICWIA